MANDLFSIIKSISNQRIAILKFVLISVFAGNILYWVLPKKYDASAIFILKNPVFADRNNIYSYEAKFLNYTASDDDVDQLISMVSSDSLQHIVINTMHLGKAYNYDTTDAEEIHKLRKYFQKNLKIYRNEYKSLVLTYSDKDPVRAANVANLCVDLLEFSLRNFYNGMRKNMCVSIMNKIAQEDSAIALLTDSLITLREKYEIYDIISPSRYNIMLSSIKGNGKKGFARGIELVQNVESIKDEIVGDRAKHLSLANQYSTGIEVNEMSLTEIVQRAIPPFRHVFLEMLVTTLVCSVLGLLFAIVYVLSSNFIRNQKTASFSA